MEHFIYIGGCGMTYIKAFKRRASLDTYKQLWIKHAMVLHSHDITVTSLHTCYGVNFFSQILLIYGSMRVVTVVDWISNLVMADGEQCVKMDLMMMMAMWHVIS